MGEVLISVVVPVYNAEKYLSDCVESILGQSYAAWELILVDDGSTDDSGAICDSYEKREVRVRVIHRRMAELPGPEPLACSRLWGSIFILWMPMTGWSLRH